MLFWHLLLQNLIEDEEVSVTYGHEQLRRLLAIRLYLCKNNRLPNSMCLPKDFIHSSDNWGTTLPSMISAPVRLTPRHPHDFQHMYLSTQTPTSTVSSFRRSISGISSHPLSLPWPAMDSHSP